MREAPETVLVQLIAKHGFLLGRPVRRAWWEQGRKRGDFRFRAEKAAGRRHSYLIVDAVTSEILGRLRDRRYLFIEGRRPKGPRVLSLYLMPKA